jgi:hypothetical protein
MGSPKFPTQPAKALVRLQFRDMALRTWWWGPIPVRSLRSPSNF